MCKDSVMLQKKVWKDKDTKMQLDENISTIVLSNIPY